MQSAELADTDAAVAAPHAANEAAGPSEGGSPPCFGEKFVYTPPPAWTNKLGYVWLRITLPGPGKEVPAESTLLFDEEGYNRDMAYIRHVWDGTEPSVGGESTLVDVLDGMPSALRTSEPVLRPITVEQLMGTQLNTTGTD